MRISLWLLVAAPIALSQAAQAYIPPSQFIVKSIATKKSGLKFVRVHSQVTALSSDKATGVQFKETTIWDGENHELLSSAYDDEGRELFHVDRRSALPLPDGLLFDNRGAELLQQLKAKEVPIRVESELLRMKDEEERRASETETFGRWKGLIAWVVGPLDRYEPQIWVEKDTFLPVRLIADNASGDLMEYRFENYRYFHEFPYPREITLAHKTDTKIRDEVLDVTVGDSPDVLGPKDARHVHTEESRSRGLEGFDSGSGSASGGVRDLIQQYYGNLR